MIKVFGHLAPDTDSVCAPLVWAWYMTEVLARPAQAFVQEPLLNTEAVFVLKYWGFESLPLLGELSAADQVVVVDTNNASELPGNINEVELLQIIDHHRLMGGLKTLTPPDITIRPLACTTTVMFDLMGENTGRLTREIAGLMLSAIISDTLEFRSPTTTDHDKIVAEKLAVIAQVDISELAIAMFEAKSDVSAFSDAELIKLDSKKIQLTGGCVRISSLETTSPEAVLARKEGLMQAMPQVCTEDGVDEVLLFVVDILKEEATLLIPNDRVKTIAEKSFGVSVTGDRVLLPGVVSRKKQIVPVLKI